MLARLAISMFLAFLSFAGCAAGQSDELAECFGPRCPGHAAVDVRAIVETCGESGCTTRPLRRSIYLGMIQLFGPPQDRCGPGDCGAVTTALREQGWAIGRWRIVPPWLRGLKTPQPVTVDLEEHEVEQVTLTYRSVAP